MVWSCVAGGSNVWNLRWGSYGSSPSHVLVSISNPIMFIINISITVLLCSFRGRDYGVKHCEGHYCNPHQMMMAMNTSPQEETTVVQQSIIWGVMKGRRWVLIGGSRSLMACSWWLYPWPLLAFHLSASVYPKTNKGPCHMFLPCDVLPKLARPRNNRRNFLKPQAKLKLPFFTLPC